MIDIKLTISGMIRPIAGNSTYDAVVYISKPTCDKLAVGEILPCLESSQLLFNI